MTIRSWKLVSFGSAALAAIVAAVSLGIGHKAIATIETVLSIVLGFLGRVENERQHDQEKNAASGEGRETVTIARGEAIAIVSPAGGSDPNDEIDEAFKYVAEGRPDITIKQLTTLRRRRWNSLSPRARYRLLANRGNAKLAAQDKAEAGRDYIRASEYQSTDEDARAFEALGYLLLDDRERAHELAVKLCDEHPTLSRAQMIRIRTTADNTPIDELLESVPTAVRGNPEVMLALHDRALAEDRPDQAEEILRSDFEAVHNWALLALALGGTILQQEIEGIQTFLGIPVAQSETRLTEAVELFSEVLEKASVTDPEQLSYGALLNRGTAQTILGNYREAQDDLRRAHSLRPADERAVVALSRALVADNQRLADAIETLERYQSEHSSSLVDLLLAAYLSERKGPGDLDRVITLLSPRLGRLSDLDEDGDDQRTSTVSLLIAAYIEKGEGTLALGVINDLPDDAIAPTARAAILGDALYRLGKREPALAEARRASALIHDASPRTDIGRVALLLERLEEYDEALQLWKQIVSPTLVSPETYHLLHCARQREDDRFVLDFCRALRNEGIWDRRCLGFEIEVLVQYGEYDRAGNLLRSYLEVKPDDKIAWLNFAVLGIQLGWENAVDLDPSKLPRLEELDSAQLGARVAAVLRAGPDPVQAVDYAYDLYRKFPDDPDSNRALITAVLMPGTHGLTIDKPTSVAPGTAVCYVETGHDERRWLIIENLEDPSPSRREYPRSHPLAAALLGKGVNDQFPLSEGSLRERCGTIVEIQDKRVFRANDLLQEWNERFPDKPFFEAVPVPASESSTAEDFSELTAVMKRIAEHNDQLEEAYELGRLPIASLALFNGRTVFETVSFVTGNPDLFLRACRGNESDFEAAYIALDHAESVVLDPTAITTLDLLEQSELLDVLPFECFITESSLQELRDLIRDDVSPRPSGYLGYKNGRLWITETDSEVEADRRARVADLISILEQNCKIVGGSDLANVELATRQALAKTVTASVAQAAAVANRQGLVLWSDDHLLHELIRTDLPSPRVWSQAVFFWAHHNGLIDRELNSRLTARMMRLGYFFTALNADIVLDTCEAAAWLPEDPDLAAVLASFGSPTWIPEGALQISEQTIGRIWRAAPSTDHARAVTSRLLSHLSSRPDHRGIVSHMIGNIDNLLGLAGHRSDALRELLTRFLDSGVLLL